ncbi:non-ribosomal peptide synthetase [Xanthomonas albilineans]|uniref:non-ribosomal peptide synthetase n=1 Tax=Xanthomonas albilineans TaxID=29447 RepID=UPI0005F34CC9|nr:non-ribosomal peptide synthetase [Xanthomonas albilineans]
MNSPYPSDSLPLTTNQRALWVWQKIHPYYPMNLIEALELQGPIQPELFFQAVRQLVRECENGRTSIVEENGLPRQYVAAEYQGDFPYLDMRDAASPWQAAQDWIMQKFDRPFDLVRDPLWQCVLFRLDDAHYLYAQGGHHLITDGYNSAISVQRLATLYSSYVAGIEPPANPIGTMRDLVEQEASYRASERYQRDREYWMQALANPSPPVTLSRRPGMSQCRGLLRSRGHLSSDQITRLHELGARYAASLPQVLIALVATFYHRNTGAEDLIMNMPVTGRTRRQHRDIPGMMSNAVPIRLAMAPQVPFHTLFPQVASVVKSALRHQQYSGEDIHRDLDLAYTNQQLAALGVNIEPFDYVLDFAGVKAIPHNLSNGGAHNLTIFFYDRGDHGGVYFDLDANPALYAQEELDEHRRRLLQLIESVLEDPGQTLGQLDILGEQERARLLYDWNRTDTPLPEPSTLPHWFAQQAAATPDAAAVRYDGRILDYRTLHQRSAQLAALWVKEGISAGHVIAVALPRTEQLLVVLLAVMWSGATYMPLDLSGPSERNATMLRESGATAMVCESTHWPHYAQTGLIWLDPHATTDITPLTAPRTSADGAAYVLYTSGSTGLPKGVEISHHNLANFLFAMQHELQLKTSDRVLALTTINFDIAALELYLPLICGASLVMAEDNMQHDPIGLSRLIASERITLIEATPSMWQVLLANAELPLQHVHALIGGEALNAPLATQLLQRAERLTQMYGPTETTVWSTMMPLTLDDVASGSLPIGRPVYNTRIYVLDAQQQPVPTGVSGEIYIGGAGVARGYRNRKELSDARFMPDPFATDGGRMYRTGDLGRWREDGVLEFIGRADAQLKIRGYRVEPGEVEAALLHHPAIASAAVLGHRDSNGTMHLVAYLVAADGATLPALDALRKQLQGRLPDHMMPSTCITLPTLPLTPNGKLDRKALPLPEKTSAQRYVAPRNELEQRLVALWQSMLKVERVGIHDNFFELGGNSLTAAELLARFPSQFGIELPLGSLFQASTVAGLATLIVSDDNVHSDPLAPLLRLRKGDESNPPLFCIHPVVGLGWSYFALLGQLDPSYPVYALQAPALRSGVALPDSIETIASEYLRRIRGIQPQGPYRLLGWSLGGLIAHAMTAQLHADGQEVELLVMLDAYPYRQHINALGDDAARIQATMEFLGIRLSPDQPAPVHVTDLSMLVCEHYGLLSLPLMEQFLKKDPQLLNRIAVLADQQIALASHYRPQCVDVDVLFFDAEIKPALDLSSMLDQRPDSWRDFVGELDVHSIHSDHQSMLQPATAAQIARIVDARLHRRTHAAGRPVITAHPVSEILAHG